MLTRADGGAALGIRTPDLRITSQFLTPEVRRHHHPCSAAAVTISPCQTDFGRALPLGAMRLADPGVVGRKRAKAAAADDSGALWGHAHPPGTVARGDHNPAEVLCAVGDDQSTGRPGVRVAPVAGCLVHVPAGDRNPCDRQESRTTLARPVPALPPDPAPSQRTRSRGCAAAGSSRGCPGEAAHRRAGAPTSQSGSTPTRTPRRLAHPTPARAVPRCRSWRTAPSLHPDAVMSVSPRCCRERPGLSRRHRPSSCGEMRPLVGMGGPAWTNQ